MRRTLVASILSLACLWAAAAPAAPAPAASAASAPPLPPPPAEARQQHHAEVLKRLEDHVRKQAAWRPRSKAPLRWQTAVAAPDPQSMVFGERYLRSANGVLMWRAAVDMRTRWYYVAQVGGDTPARYYGPLYELREGQFADIGSTDLPQPPPPPKPKPKPVPAPEAPASR